MLTVSVSVVIQNVTRMRILTVTFLGRKYHIDQELVNYFDQGIVDRKIIDHGIFVTVWEYKWALHNVDYMYNVD